MAAETLFDVRVLGRQPCEDARIPELINWTRTFSGRGWTPSYGPGDHGNLSCRTPHGLLVTARQTAKAALTADHFVEVVEETAVDGQPVLSCRGLLLPSTDALMHLRIYRLRPEIQAILHGHDPATLKQAEALGLPVTAVSAKTASPALLEDVLRLAAAHDYIILREHGFLALGRSVAQAGELALSWHFKGEK